MKQIKSISWMLALVLALSLCLAVPTFAEENAALWLKVQADEDGVTVNVCANTTVTDGQIEVRYDSISLTYTDLTVDSAYVLAHAANPESAGVVQIAWIAPGDYALDGTEHVLMQLHFEGENVDGFTVSGYVYTPEGDQITVEPPAGLDRLLAAVNSAKVLKPDAYTADSYARLQAALEAARAEMADPTVTEERLEAARQNVIDAVLGLLKPGQEPSVPATTEATVPATQAGSTEPQNSNLGLIIAIVAVCLVAAAVVIIVIKRKGSK